MCETVANITVLYGRKPGRWDKHTGTSKGHYTNELYKSYDRIHHLPYYCTDYISVCLKILLLPTESDIILRGLLDHFYAVGNFRTLRGSLLRQVEDGDPHEEEDGQDAKDDREDDQDDEQP